MDQVECKSSGWMARIFARIVLGGCLLLLFSTSVWAQENCDPWVARLVSIQGTVEVNRAGDGQWAAATAEETFCSGDQLRVGGGSRAVLYLFNEATIRLGPHSTLRLDQVSAPQSLFLEMVEGVAHFFSRFPQSLKLSTPFVNGVVKGTEFVVRVDRVQTLLAVYEGRVTAANPSGVAETAGGQNLVARHGSAPLVTRMVNPRQAVHWALYYPAVLDLAALQSAQPALGPAVDAFSRRDYAAAYEALTTGATDESRLLKAALDLSVGKVAAARSGLDLLLRNNPNSSAACALLAVMAVVQNDTAGALAIADKAVGLEDTAAARLARSYARQSVADLPGALADGKTAVDLDPQNPLAWARLAELQLAMGALKAAEKSAAIAVNLDDTLAHPQTVLGFAHLTRFETQAAAESFIRAAELDPAAPLPRMGLGLARIREGALAEGRELMEIAVSLDPMNSLLRSYLGKAFFEEKRDSLAARQYEVAKKLDPNDPTPWLYSAIEKQTTNRPVAALDDLQESVKRNDNRAVTRSRFLLDEDLAVRGADLARIYSDLGYDQRALYEGWAAINADPGEAAGHRFLADAYRTLPNHEIARASELLQAQMLSPLNVNPLQPAASETDLQFLAGTTAGSAALNEYTSLFVRDRVGVQGSVLAGEHNTYVDEAVVTAQGGPGVVSGGFLHYETDGFRENQDQTRDIQNVFAQARVDPTFSIQTEFHNNEAEKGDLIQSFDPDNINTATRIEDDIRRLRLGARYHPAPQADTLISVMFTDSESLTNTQTPFGQARGSNDRSSYLTEVQQQWHSGQFNLIAGAGYSSEDYKIYASAPLPSPLPPFEQEKHYDTQHLNGYLYAHVKLPRSVLWTMGLAAESSEGGYRDRDRLNPKAGLTWSITEDTTLRAAVVKKLGRDLVNDQTLEPTQVAGFNQLYEDTAGTEILRYGVAVDQRFTSRLFGGAEASRREIDTIYIIGSEWETETDNWYEDLARAYLNWAPLEWMAARVEYRYEAYERSAGNSGVEAVKELTTHYVPIGLKFFSTHGAILGVTATYVDQEGDFVTAPLGQPVVNRDDDDFWITDASLGYRLPKRYGLVSLEVRNLFNESFHYQDMDDMATEIFPERSVLGKISFSF